MSDLLPYVDINNRILTDSTGAAFPLPGLVTADVLNIGLGFVKHTADGVRVIDNFPVRSIRASVGALYAPPTNGGATLRFGPTGGDPTTADPVPYNATADALNTALTGVSPDWTPAEVVQSEAGCWLIRFVEQGSASPLQVGAVNTLTPRSFVRVRAFQLNGVWWQEIRMLQAPLAYSSLYERQLPPPPSVVEVRHGGSTLPGVVINELVALTLPANFVGAYDIGFQGRLTNLLGPQDDASTMAQALNAMWSDGVTRFNVTNPLPDTAYIECVGPLSNQGFAPDAFTLTVRANPPGLPNVSIDLRTAELAAAVRVRTALETGLPILDTFLEIEVEYVEEGKDPDDDTIPSHYLRTQNAIKIAREQIYSELDPKPEIDWLRPPAARDYIPFGPDQIITGNQHWVGAVGDDVSTEFEIDHGLDVDAMHVAVRENFSGGRLLDSTEYTVVFLDENTLRITFAEAVPLANYLVTITTAGPKSAFSDHHHSIGEVDGLEARLEEDEAAIAALEALAPSLSNTILAASGVGLAKIIIPDVQELFPVRRSFSAVVTDAIKTPNTLPRPLALLPAIHSSSGTDATLPLGDPSSTAGTLLHNACGSPIVLPGGYGQPTVSVPNGGYFTSDDRLFYLLTESGTSTSFFPTGFEREFFSLAITDKMWQSGNTFHVEFDLTLQMLRQTTSTQYVLVIEHGTITADTTPATTEPLNFKDIVWSTTPLLKQQLILTGLQLQHHFGCKVYRSLTDVITADQLKYNAWTAADSHPAGTTFALRARLIDFDTQDSVTDAVGYVYRALTGATAAIE